MSKPIQPEEELREKLAAIEHERWSDWQKYVHSKLTEDVRFENGQYFSTGNRIMNVKDFAHWESQIARPYEKLTDAEKASDMAQVDRYWPLIATHSKKQELRVTGETSDGYHTFNELYEYRMMYNAALFNEWATQGKYDVHLSYRHSDGELCFGKEDYFVVVAELPTGQITNHYKGKYRHLFAAVPERELANKYDGHTPKQALERLAQLTALEGDNNAGN